MKSIAHFTVESGIRDGYLNEKSFFDNNELGEFLSAGCKMKIVPLTFLTYTDE